MTQDDDFFEPLEMPTNVPQFEQDLTSSIVQLIEDAPKWESSFAVELVHLARQHVAVRALIAFPLEVARMFELKLRNEDELHELMRCQGAIRGLVQLHSIVLESLDSADTYTKDTDDELE